MSNFRLGLVAFDVGVGRIYTSLGLIARVRQEMRVRHPIILAPDSIEWRWRDDDSDTPPAEVDPAAKG